MAETTADKQTPLTTDIGLSLSHILANGLVFFTALTIRDYLQSNVSIIPVHRLPFNPAIRAFIRFAISLLIVAGLLVLIKHWEKDINKKLLHRQEE